MKTCKLLTIIVILGILFFSACTNAISTITPSLPTPTVFPTPTVIQTEVTTIKEIDWQTEVFYEPDRPYSISNTSVDGFKGRIVNGSQFTFERDTRWEVSIKVSENSASTGLIIEGSGSEFSIPNLFLGYSGRAWQIGYAINGDYSFFKTLMVGGLEASFQLSISSDGKLLELTNGEKLLFSQSFDDPVFGLGTEVTTATLCGPQSSLEISYLSISRNESQLPYATVAQTIPDYFSTPAPVIPAVSGSITVENASHLTRLASLGEGDLINVQLSPDGRYVLVGNSNGILVLDAATLERVNFLQSTMKPEKIYFFDNGTKVAALDSYHVRGHVWTFPEGEEIREVKLACNLDPTGNDKPFYSVPSKNLEYTFTYITNVAGLCNASTGEPIYILDYKVNYGFAISPDEKYLAFSTIDKLVVIQYADGLLLKEIPEPGVKYIFFYPDGKTMGAVFGSQARFWDLSSFEMIDTLKGVGAVSDYGPHPIFSPDGSIMVFQNENTFRLIRTADREYLSSVNGVNLEFTADSQSVIVDSGTGKVSYYQINADRSAITFINSFAGMGIRRGRYQRPGFLSDDKNFLLVQKSQKNIGAWLTELRVFAVDNNERSTFDVIKQLGWGFYFQDSVWLQNLNQFAVILGSVFEHSRFFILNTNTGMITQVSEENYESQQSRIKFTAQSDMLVFSRDEIVTIWDFQTNMYGNPKEGINGYTDFFDNTNNLQSPNGRYLITINEEDNPGYRKSVRVNINGEMIENYSGYENLEYAFSPDSTMLAISTFSALRGINVSVYDLATEERLFFSGDEFAEGDFAPKVAFSPDGNYLAILPQYGYPQIWGIP